MTPFFGQKLHEVAPDGGDSGAIRAAIEPRLSDDLLTMPERISNLSAPDAKLLRRAAKIIRASKTAKQKP